MSGRSVVTGLGVVAPNGLGTEEYWRATLEGRSGIGRLTRFDPTGYPATLAGEVTGFDDAAELPSRLLPQTDRVTRLSLAASARALVAAGVDLDEVPEFARGVVTASTFGGFEFGQRELSHLWANGSQHVSAYQAFAWFYAVNTGQIGIRHDMRGPCGVVVSDHAGGLDAVAQARRTLRRGSRLVLTGGVDSALAPWGWFGHLAGGTVSTREDPARAYLPFDGDASGHVPGEGGAILVLEDEDAARERGVSGVLGVVSGYAATFDPRPGSGREPGLRRAIELALDDARLTAGDIDVVFADAAGVPERDREESAALAAVFGPRGVPVTAPKTLTGRLCAGGAPLDLAAALLSIRDGVIPPTPHVRPAADIGRELDLVTGLRQAAVRHALVVARGRGGFNSTMIVSAYDD